MMEIFLDEVNKSIEGEFEMYFRYIDKIASGAFGTVIRAVYLVNNEEVAVKIIDKNNHNFKNFNKLGIEINILRQLNHRNIVRLIDFIETNTKLYIITEYIKDGTLKELMDNRAKEGNTLFCLFIYLFYFAYVINSPYISLISFINVIYFLHICLFIYFLFVC